MSLVPAKGQHLHPHRGNHDFGHANRQSTHGRRGDGSAAAAPHPQDAIQLPSAYSLLTTAFRPAAITFMASSLC